MGLGKESQRPEQKNTPAGGDLPAGHENPKQDLDARGKTRKSPQRRTIRGASLPTASGLSEDTGVIGPANLIPTSESNESGPEERDGFEPEDLGPSRLRKAGIEAVTVKTEKIADFFTACQLDGKVIKVTVKDDEREEGNIRVIEIKAATIKRTEDPMEKVTDQDGIPVVDAERIVTHTVYLPANSSVGNIGYIDIVKVTEEPLEGDKLLMSVINPIVGHHVIEDLVREYLWEDFARVTLTKNGLLDAMYAHYLNYDHEDVFGYSLAMALTMYGILYDLENNQTGQAGVQLDKLRTNAKRFMGEMGTNRGQGT